MAKDNNIYFLQIISGKRQNNNVYFLLIINGKRGLYSFLANNVCQKTK